MDSEKPSSRTKPLELDVLLIIFQDLTIQELWIMRRVCLVWKEAAEIRLRNQSVVCTQTFARSYLFHMNFCDDPRHFADRKCIIPNVAIRTKKIRKNLLQFMTGIKSIRVAYDPLSKSFLNYLLNQLNCQIECISCCEVSPMIRPDRLKHFRIFSRGRIHGREMVNSLLTRSPNLEVIDIEKCHVLPDTSGEGAQPSASSSGTLALQDLHVGLKTIRLPDCDDFFSVLLSQSMESVVELELSTRDESPINAIRRNFDISEMIRPARNLQRLKLEHKALSSDGYAIIVHFLLRCNPNLSELSLSFQPNLPETHIGYVQIFSHFRSLRDIDLNLWRYDPHSTDEVIEVICHQHRNSIRNITLKSRNLLESTLFRFAELQNLRRLYVRTRETFSQDAIDRFHEIRELVTDVSLDFNIY